MARQPGYRVPCDWLAEGDWPTGEFERDAPEDVAVAVAIAKALQVALEGRNKTRIATAAGIERSTLYDILAGRSWPDMISLSKLERELDQGLWPQHPVEELKRRPSLED